MIEEWHGRQVMRSTTGIDPLWKVLCEGGPWHMRAQSREYFERLRKTGRGEWAERIASAHVDEIGIARSPRL